MVKQLSDELGVAFGTSGVRGLAKNLTPELCFIFVKSFLRGVCPNVAQVAVGIDLRPSSPCIAKACLAAIEASGAQAIYCGALPTPALAFYALQNNMPAVMITGSHIPFDRNGIKFYRPDGEISKADELMIMEGNVSIPNLLADTLRLKTLPPANNSAVELFKARYTKLFPMEMLQGKRIGVYEHSSVARDVITDLLVYFGADVISLDRTETFVPIDTEAVSEEDKQKGLDWAKKYELDAIVSTDGDGDRPLIANEKGEWLRGDVLGVLCANYLKATHVVAPINVNTVLELESEKEDYLRVCLRTKIGSPYVISGMEGLLAQDSKAKIVGYEANGGFLVGSDFLINGEILKALLTRDSLLPIMIILVQSKENNCLVSQLSLNFSPRFSASDRVKDVSHCSSSRLLSELKENHVIRKEFLSWLSLDDLSLNIIDCNETDGLRLELSNNDVVHLRASGNAPELRCYSESSEQYRAQEIVDKVLMNIRRIIDK